MFTCCTLRRAGASCLFLLAGLLLSTIAAAQQPGQPLDKDHAAKMERSALLFKQQVRPMLSQRCLRCHGGKKTEAEFDIHSRESLLKGGTSGPAVVPGKAKDSLLYKVLAHLKEPNMPQ